MCSKSCLAHVKASLLLTNFILFIRVNIIILLYKIVAFLSSKPFMKKVLIFIISKSPRYINFKIFVESRSVMYNAN